MASTIAALIVKIVADVADLVVGMEKTRQAVDRNELSFGKLVGAYVTGQTIVDALKTGFGKLTQFLGESIEAAAQAEAAHTTLNTALRAQGVSVPQTAAAYDLLAQQFQRTTVFEDDLITGMQALLVQVGGVMPSQMQRALTASTNLAAGLGILFQI